MEKKANAPVIVCPECDNFYEIDINSKDTPCSHQRKFLEEIKADPRFKEW